MSRLIDADELIAEIKRLMPTGGARGVFLQFVDDAPTVDAVPVIHGEWERIPYSFVGGYRCSCCGQKSLERTFNFCGNCGAKMDGKKVQE